MRKIIPGRSGPCPRLIYKALSANERKWTQIKTHAFDYLHLRLFAFICGLVFCLTWVVGMARSCKVSESAHA